MKNLGVFGLLLCLAPAFAGAESLIERNRREKQRDLSERAMDQQKDPIRRALQKEQPRDNLSCTSDSQCGNGTCDLITKVCKCNYGWITPTSSVNNGAACSYKGHSRARAVALNAAVLGIFGAGNFDIGNNALGAGPLTLTLMGGVLIAGGIARHDFRVSPRGLGIPMIFVGGLAVFGSVSWGWVAESIFIAFGMRKDGKGQDTV